LGEESLPEEVRKIDTRNCNVDENTKIVSNNCCDCKEGGIFGDSVYCSIDGRFHPLRDDFTCKSFVQKEFVKEEQKC
jgi:hypothetical protein